MQLVGPRHLKYLFTYSFIAVRVTKPEVPSIISEAYLNREIERTRLLIKIEQQKLVQKRSQIEKKTKVIEAQTQNKVSAIENEIKLAQKIAYQKISLLENEIMILKETASAKGKKYRLEKLIELNKIKLTPQNELANILNNLKNSPKEIYSPTIGDYFEQSISLVGERISKNAQTNN